MSEVPLPTANASDIYEVSSAIVTTLIPPLALAKPALDILIRKRLEDGQRTLISEIERRGLSALSDRKWDYYVPSAYSFLEQVRLGEYNHNLRTLAGLIAGDLHGSDEELDPGKIARIARKLEMLPKDHFLALSRCPRAFEIYSNSSEADGYWLCIDAAGLQASFVEVGMDVKAIKCQEYLHELSCRGILTSGDHPNRMGGSFYYKNQFFDEIIIEVGNIPV